MIKAAATEIDVWNLATFDDELRGLLENHADLIRSYSETDREIYSSFDLYSGPDRPLMRPENLYASDFICFEEWLEEPMSLRTIRAFHYTRMTDAELEHLLEEGVHLSTPETLLRRLTALVGSGDLSPNDVDALLEASPFQSQLENRQGMFWMTSCPVPIGDTGVERLLQYWGGEVASFHQNNSDLLAKLAQIGRPRVVEIAAPLSATKHAFSAGRAVVAAFGRSIGCKIERRDFDLYVGRPLPTAAVIRVHTEGEREYKLLGHSE